MSGSRLQSGGMCAGGLIQVGEGTGGATIIGGSNARLVTGPNGRKVVLVEVFRNLAVTAKLTVVTCGAPAWTVCTMNAPRC